MNAAARAPVDRTSLSWQRTAAHSTLVALFAAITAVRLGEPAVASAAGVLILTAVVVAAAGFIVWKIALRFAAYWAGCTLSDVSQS